MSQGNKQHPGVGAEHFPPPPFLAVGGGCGMQRGAQRHKKTNILSAEIWPADAHVL